MGDSKKKKFMRKGCKARLIYYHQAVSYTHLRAHET